MTTTLNGSGPHVRHFLDLKDLSAETLRGVLDTSAAMKRVRVKGQRAAERPLTGKMLAMVFDRPSTRTRVSFDVAMRELGGETLMLTGREMQLGRGETIADTARVLSRYVDIIMMRTTVEDKLLEMAKYATVPVINGLTDRTHPCQLMADVMTFEERWLRYVLEQLRARFSEAVRETFSLEITVPTLPFPRVPMAQAQAAHRRKRPRWRPTNPSPWRLCWPI